MIHGRFLIHLASAKVSRKSHLLLNLHLVHNLEWGERDGMTANQCFHLEGNLLLKGNYDEMKEMKFLKEI